MASSGPNNPTSAVNDGTGSNWLNAVNVFESDNSYATVSAPAKRVLDSSVLLITGFGFTIPAGATIDGIKVEMERKKSPSGSVSDVQVGLTKDGMTGGGDPENVNVWLSSEGYVTWGSATNLWGLSWTPAEVNDADFGFAFSASIIAGSSASCTASIDHVRITIYYTAPAGTRRKMIRIANCPRLTVQRVRR
jgi:hypothetical protein